HPNWVATTLSSTIFNPLLANHVPPAAAVMGLASPKKLEPLTRRQNDLGDGIEARQATTPG
ncbi:hypothetical protein, partial [Erythrobacter sp. YJ-T3-07]|uniref:hypothetical protein n=1 Tax=Erythrobacter sp. YJ-T3-07 TaxID=2793063 RepID=UPI001F355B93